VAVALAQLTSALALLSDEPCELSALQIIASRSLAAQYYPHHDPASPLLIVLDGGPDDGAGLWRCLSLAYPPEHVVRLLGSERREAAALAALETSLESWVLAIFLAPLPAPATYEALQDIAAHLRAPEGCPWDRQLTWGKLRAFLLEESHELLAALDASDPAKVLEEQGDVLLQIAMQVQIASENGLYRFPEAAARIIAKLVRRHPHVFGDVTVSGTGEVLANWEAIKAEERASSGERRSPLSGIPPGLPALAQADAYLDRMSRGRDPIDRPAPRPELTDLFAGREVTPDAVGRVLFEIVAWARARGVDAESALRETNARFADGVAARHD
jgi:tetrapyrrole methylase family protein/MazG family protein